MVSRAIIRTGDLTTHGGVVIDGFPAMLIYGKTAAGIGHTGYCPTCKTTFSIVQGSGKAFYLGHQVALEGMLTSCGARLIASQSECVVDDELGGGNIFAGAVTPSITKTTTEEQAQYYPKLLLKNQNNVPFSSFSYQVIFADGSRFSGKTDIEGCTAEIPCDKRLQVQEITLSSAEQSCCSNQNTEGNSYTFTPEQVFIEPVEVVGVRKEVKLKPNSRLLTAGEITLAQSVFKDSIDYSKVRVHKGEYLWFGLQNDRTAMTPNGEMYFPDGIHFADFSIQNLKLRSFFLHEMTHVWQYQLGYSPFWAGLWMGLKGGYGTNSLAYRYEHLLPVKNDFSEFNMEQQGKLIEQYYEDQINGVYPANHDLQRIMTRFIRNPKDETLLPTTTDF